MSQPFVGEVRCVGFSFAPAGWAFCNGALVPISENDTLFNLIGTTYGGDGQSTFALPDLQGRTPIHMGQNSSGNNYTIGEIVGVESVTIITQQYPIHNHALLASGNAGNANLSGNNVLGGGQAIYETGTAPAIAMNANMLLPYGGGSQPHENMQPYLVLNWIISLFGVFPSQN